VESQGQPSLAGANDEDIEVGTELVSGNFHGCLHFF
jgi:hypothetical protein